MTRQEVTGIRDLHFSGWVRNNLPDSKTGFLVSDLDFILSNYKTKKIMFLEIKTRMTLLRDWQSILFENIGKWISIGIDQSWQYLGFHIIMFENTFFNDGKVYLNNKEITEKDLIEFLSF